MTSIAIIGTGYSGLSAAHTLRDAGWKVTLFEKSRGVSGRAATRRRGGFIYDHGAQYIKQGGPSSVSLITERFLAPDLIDISKPVWTFDGQNQIAEGDPAQNAEPKWNYRNGLTTLAKRMAEELEIRLETQISQVQRQDGKWELLDSNGQRYNGFDRLLVTIPAPQAAALFQTNTLEQEVYSKILASLEQASYNVLISVMLGYRPRPQERPYYALVNTDKAHPISWLAWEHEKAPERAPADSGLLIAQMAPQYSKDHWQTADHEIVADVAEHVQELLNEKLASPFFSDLQRWRYALPAKKIDATPLNQLALPLGLAFCGDAFVGGRAHLALEHGIHVAQHLLQA